MKKLAYIIMFLSAIVLASCKDDGDDSPAINAVSITVSAEGEEVPDGTTVTLTDKATSTVYTETTDSSVVTFNVIAGVYEATATITKEAFIYNGTATVTVTDNTDNTASLNLLKSTTSQIIIKELYVGGCMDNDGAKWFQNDAYVILYNNSSLEADASNICFGMVHPTNSNTTSYYMQNGELTYTDYLPCWNAIWWFKTGTEVKIPAYSQILISIKGAIDNTATYTNSVDLSQADYAMYDPDVFTNANVYPTPDASIPTSNYLETYLYAMGNAWPISTSSPAFVLISPENTTMSDFVTTASNIENAGSSKAFACAKVPLSWIIDGVEVFDIANLAKSNKRLLSSVDAGYVKYVNKLGYTIYRNVDQEATEALAENSGKLVTGYTGGTDDVENGSTDPSGIDAEASIANGAHIIYMDTNNSTNDFHMRKVASIKE